MEINSLQNPLVKDWVRLKNNKYRNLTRTFLVEQENLISEARRAGLLRQLITLKGETPLYDDYPCCWVSAEVMRKISGNVSMNKQVGLCDFKTEELSWGDRLVILDDVRDPANVGAIIRTALALGYDGMILSDNSVDIYHQKLIKAAMGANFFLPIKRCELTKELSILRKSGYKLLATDLTATKTLSEVRIPKRFAVVFGNEGSGIRAEVAAACDLSFKIPLAEFDSLNVAVAAGICLYELGRENQHG